MIDYANSRGHDYSKLKSIDPLNHVGIEDYISLVLSRKAEKVPQHTVRMRPDEVRTPLDFDDIFKPVSDKELDFVLAIGAPGIGKSTLALQIARKWQITTNYTLAILVRLRKQRHQTANTIDELYPEGTPDNIKGCIEGVQGKGVLWILDGFDELPSERQHNTVESVYHRLCQKEFLSMSTILITSRHSAATTLQKAYLKDHETSKQIEIVGFNSTQVEQYARQAFMSTQEPEKLLANFKSYCLNNPVISALMDVPLNTAIITFVFKLNFKDSNPLPYTLTRLYSSLVCNLLRRHQLKVYGEDHIPITLMTKEDIQKLPSENRIREQFNQLTELAYNGILKDQYVFTDVNNDLSLMSNISSIHDSGKTVYSYNFLHTTLQEYLAAVYVSQRSNLIETVVHKEVIVTFIFGISSQMEAIDNITLSIAYTYTMSLQLRLLYEYPNFGHFNPYEQFHVDRVYYELEYDYYIAGYLIAHHNITIPYVVLDNSYKIDILLKGLNSKCHSGSVATGMGKPQNLVIRCNQIDYNSDYHNDLSSLRRLLRSNMFEKEGIISHHSCDRLIDSISSIIIDDFERVGTVFQCELGKEIIAEKVYSNIIMFGNSSSEVFKQVVCHKNLKELFGFSSIMFEKEGIISHHSCDRLIDSNSSIIIDDFERVGTVFECEPGKEINIQKIKEYSNVMVINSSNEEVEQVVCHKNLKELFGFSSIKNLKIDQFSFRSLSFSILDTITHNKNIKQLLIEECYLSIEFLQAVFSSYNVIEYLDIYLFKESYYSYGEFVSTLFSKSSLSYLGIPSTFIKYDSDFMNLLLNKNLQTLTIYHHSSSLSSRLPPFTKDIRPQKYRHLKLLHIVVKLDVTYSKLKEYLNHLLEYISDYVGPKCTISLVVERFSNTPILEDLIELVKAAKANTCSVSLQLDNLLYRQLPYEYQLNYTTRKWRSPYFFE